MQGQGRSWLGVILRDLHDQSPSALNPDLRLTIRHVPVSNPLASEGSLIVDEEIIRCLEDLILIQFEGRSTDKDLKHRDLEVVSFANVLCIPTHSERPDIRGSLIMGQPPCSLGIEILIRQLVKM